MIFTNINMLSVSHQPLVVVLVTFRIVSELTARVVAELLIQLSSVSDGFRMAYRHPLPSF